MDDLNTKSENFVEISQGKSEVLKGQKSAKKNGMVSVLVVVFLLAVFWGLMSLWNAFASYADVVRCKGNLGDIARDMDDNYEESFLYIGNIPYFKDELILTESFDKNMLICLGCDKPYIYKPVAPDGNRVKKVVAEIGPLYFVMWCPEPCHKNRRIFLHASGLAYAYKDDEVAWFFQKFVYYCNEEEIQRENQYRRTQGIATLK